MSTGAIIAIVVVVLIILALLAFVLPRMRRTAEARARERELEQRRDQVATEQQEIASEREREADAAEQRARMAQTEAERQRSEAQLHAERAEMHQRGLADEELVEDHERDRFAPALEKRDAELAQERREGTPPAAGGGVTSTPREGGTVHEPAGTTEPGATGTGASAAGGGPRTEYEQGRIDEREAEDAERRQP